MAADQLGREEPVVAGISTSSRAMSAWVRDDKINGLAAIGGFSDDFDGWHELEQGAKQEARGVIGDHDSHQLPFAHACVWLGKEQLRSLRLAASFQAMAGPISQNPKRRVASQSRSLRVFSRPARGNGRTGACAARWGVPRTGPAGDHPTASPAARQSGIRDGVVRATIF